MELTNQKPASAIPLSPVKKPLLPKKILVALAIFTLASTAAVAIIPYLAAMFGNNGQPTLIQISLTGLVLILLTAILLGYTSKIIGFSVAWFLLAFAYNALIIVMKFIVPPASFYEQTFYLGFFGFNPNSGADYPTLAAFVMLLYIAVLWGIYIIHKKRLARKLGISAPPKPKRSGKHWLALLATICLVPAILTGGAIFAFPLMFTLPVITYFRYLAALWWVPLVLLVAIILAIFTGNQAFSQVEIRALELRDSTILASFFWLGLSLILIYHGLWAIYMGVLLSIWPFKTISPSGK